MKQNEITSANETSKSDLKSQHSRISFQKQRHELKLVEVGRTLIDQSGTSGVKLLLWDLYRAINGDVTSVFGNEMPLTEENQNRIIDEVYTRITVACALLDVSEASTRIEHSEFRLQLTEKGVAV